MNNLIISIFGNKVFTEILKELNIFANAKIILLENSEQIVSKEIFDEQIIIFFINENNIDYYSEFIDRNLPVLLVNDPLTSIKKFNNIMIDQIAMPFKILNFKNKIIAALARYKFKRSSIIELGQYTIDKNERKIKKNNLELKLTEKEINFLIFFTSHDKSISKDFILKNLWNYSSESNTHTVETHIHRLRKKILKKFNDKNFIKSDNKGYYI